MKRTLTLLALPALLVLAACGSRSSHTLEALAGSKPQIIGGEAVESQDEIAKHIIGIEHPAGGVFCTGVLIRKDLVLTAAHCTQVGVAVTSFKIVFGQDLNGHVERRKVVDGRVTERWTQMTMSEAADLKAEWGDLAVLKLNADAPAGFEPARILGDASRLQEGMDVTLAGYGLTAMPNTETFTLLKAIVKLSNPKITPSEMEFKQYEGKGACHGDSGGPAFTTINNKVFLIGITSRAATFEGASTCLEGSIYTNVAAHINFLVQTAKLLK